MPSTCVFEFDRPDPVYYSGEVINGRIQLTTTSEKSVREVYILFEGTAKVHWNESRTRTVNGKTEHYTEHFRGTEKYLETKTKVFDEGTLPAGTHSYTYCIPLPLECPTSCVEKHGHIRYEVKLVLNRAFRFDNVFQQPLTVLKQFNLNMHPEFLLPIVSEDIKYFCCWPCSSGPVNTTLTIPFGAYAPGQSINYKLEIDNQSVGYDLGGIKLKLIQTYRFTAHIPRHKTRSISNTLAQTSKAELCLRLTKRLVEGSLEIPSIPPSSTGSGIIHVSYQIKMTIDTGGCHTDAEIEIPMTIGTVPLVQSASDPSHVADLQPFMPPTPDTPLDGPPSYDNYKPPSFEQATSIGSDFIDTDVDEHHRAEGFIPKYPMYKNFAMPSAPPVDNMNGFDTGNVPLLQNPPRYTRAPEASYSIDDAGIPSRSTENTGIGWRA